MLNLENINVWFGRNHILRDVSCEVERGDFIVIVGTNGAGKTTLFDTIAGKVKPTGGKIILEGADITSMGELERASFITRIFQNTRFNSVGSFTVAQNLAIAHYKQRNVRFVDGMQSMPYEKAEQLLQSIGMNPALLEKRMDALSGGQQQLLAFVMAMQHIPKIVLLDEPTAALDPQAATKLLQYAAACIKQHAITTLLITHDPYIALSIGNKIWILENGKITKQYNAQEKQHLRPEQLIGHIDYAQLIKNN